jgi:hypothetical protein
MDGIYLQPIGQRRSAPRGFWRRQFGDSPPPTQFNYDIVLGLVISYVSGARFESEANGYVWTSNAERRERLAKAYAEVTAKTSRTTGGRGLKTERRTGPKVNSLGGLRGEPQPLLVACSADAQGACER